MKRALCWALTVPCILVTGRLGAAVGELKPVPIDAKTMAAGAFGAQWLYTREVTLAPEGCGTVHPQAKVADFTASGVPVTVALDATNADANRPDLVRLDFTGRCRFQGAATLPLMRGLGFRHRIVSGLMPAGEHYRFGPAMLKVPRGGSALPVCVSGQYFVRSGDETYRYVSLSLFAAVEGSCRFGEKVCGVRVLDNNSNLRFADGLGIRQKDGRVLRDEGWRGLVADRVCIDTASGTYKTTGAHAYCGQLVRVNGAWYRLTVSEDGSKVSVEPGGGGIGRIVVPGDKWSVTLIGTKNVLVLSGGAEPIDVPADQYVAANYEGSFGSGTSTKPHRIRSGFYVISDQEKGKVFDVKAGVVTKITVGAPLTARVAVSQSQGTVKLDGLVTDASGARVSSLYGPNGRPPAPKVTIYNDKREAIYSTSLKYG